MQIIKRISCAHLILIFGLLKEALINLYPKNKAKQEKATKKMIIPIEPSPLLIALPQSSNQLQSKLFINHSSSHYNILLTKKQEKNAKLL